MRSLNLGILAHVDAGKTSLTERLLLGAGVIDELGSVDDGNTQTDSLALERSRGITIKSAVVSFVVGDVTINLIDTPGHPDFIAEVERVLSVLDGAVLVVSAVEGVQAQTRVLMRALQRLRVPTLFFVNKLDRRGRGPRAGAGEIAGEADAGGRRAGRERGRGAGRPRRRLPRRLSRRRRSTGARELAAQTARARRAPAVRGLGDHRRGRDGAGRGHPRVPAGARRRDAAGARLRHGVQGRARRRRARRSRYVRLRSGTVRVRERLGEREGHRDQRVRLGAAAARRAARGRDRRGSGGSTACGSATRSARPARRDGAPLRPADARDRRLRPRRRRPRRAAPRADAARRAGPADQPARGRRDLASRSTARCRRR